MRHTRRRLYTTSLATALAAAGFLGTMTMTAPSASATTWTEPVSCSGVNVRKSYSTTSTIVGVAFRGDLDRITKVKYNTNPPNLENSWLYGTITRKSDGIELVGWVTSACVSLRA